MATSSTPPASPAALCGSLLAKSTASAANCPADSLAADKYSAEATQENHG